MRFWGVYLILDLCVVCMIFFKFVVFINSFIEKNWFLVYFKWSDLKLIFVFGYFIFVSLKWFRYLKSIILLLGDFSSNGIFK